VNFGPNLGWENTFQALFRTPFFRKMTQRVQAEPNPELKKYLAKMMGKRMEEELLRFAAMPAWSAVKGGWV